MKIALFHSAMLLLHIADLITTSQVTSVREGNPLMRAAWDRYGFGILIVFKVLGWLAMLLYHLVLLKYLPHLSKGIWAVMFVGLALMVVVVLWNISKVYLGG